MYCVYKHSSPSGKVYIGITSNNPLVRWKNGQGYKAQTLFYRAILKYGWDNFDHELLFTGLSASEAKQKEIELIALFKSNNCQYGYNATSGGDGCSGRSVSNETREKLRIANTGRKFSEKTRQKMSASQTKRFQQCPKKPASEETRKLISKARMGKQSPNKGKFGYDNKTSKTVLMYTKGGTFITQYASTLEAERILGVCPADISKCCHGKRKSAGGYVWRYADDIEEQRIS